MRSSGGLLRCVGDLGEQLVAVSCPVHFLLNVLGLDFSKVWRRLIFATAKIVDSEIITVIFIEICREEHCLRSLFGNLLMDFLFEDVLRDDVRLGLRSSARLLFDRTIECDLTRDTLLRLLAR